MIDLIANRFIFTVIIMLLYIINGLIQLYLKEYLWAGYFLSCGVITFFTILLMVYERI
jgi:hypothetical protein